VTEGRIIPAPGRPGWRTFRTGDVVRIGPDGMLRVIGRTDRQVKINGMLVHPAEIESVLKTQPGVIDAAVVACPTRSGDTLHGFIAAADPAHATLIPALRDRLRAALPGPFRPATLTLLEELPRLPGGKVDLIKLREMARG
jgi:acyl-CoA synthetase (AMP-forming)/AMP-acid ligase II